MSLTLVLGGTRSGKSAVAEAIAAEAGASVTYVATAVVNPEDAGHVARIEAHQVRRPHSWVTVECTDPHDLAPLLTRTAGVVLLDSLGTWLSSQHNFEADVAGLAAALAARPSPTIVVSEEVGLAVHPPTELGRRYVDAMGELNQAVAAVAQRVLLVVAGRTLELG